MAGLSDRQRTALLTEVRARLSERQLSLYAPYPKQTAFHQARDAQGQLAIERLFMAGNQLGKTKAGGCEAAMHLTGRYPDWWQGHRFKRGGAAWAAGVTGVSTRDNPQRYLLGRPGAYGTGTIPAADIVTVKSAMGVPDAVDHCRIRHVSGDESILYFKTYEMGREKWQGESLDWIWFDEEPPMTIYSEGLTRLSATGGIAFITFTPLLGQSDVVLRFLKEKPPGTAVTVMTIDDAPHYSPDERAAIIARYPAHERDARARGVPFMGSGRIFPIDESLITVEPFRLPSIWPRIAGIDFGYDHPTAVVWLAWDRDTDTIYLYDCYRASELSPPLHAATIRAKGSWIPVAWPHDGNNDTAAGPQLAKQYRDAGVAMRPENAKFPVNARSPQNSRISVEAGVQEMLNRMETGKWKVFRHLSDWLEEFRMYHRKDGKIVKEHDDAISASRYAMMDLRFAKVAAPARPVSQPARVLDAEMGY